jgi:hypothetical protein
MSAPSGLFPPVLTSGTLFSGYPFFSVDPGDAYLITLISGDYNTTGRIFESPTDLFVYRLGSILMWDGSTDFNRVGSDCAALCETASGILIAAANDVYRKTSTISTAQHDSPIVSGWRQETILSGYLTRDSMSDDNYFRDVPTLFGNYFANSFPRIVRNDSNGRPLGSVSKSDAGITQITPNIAQITDIEAV